MKFTLSLTLILFASILHGQVFEDWDALYDGPSTQGGHQGYHILLDDQGNVFVSGTSYGSDSTHYDIVLIKYDAAGSELWATRYDGGHQDYDGIAGMDIDHLGNIYVTGRSRISYYYDFVTLKYDSQGNLLWERRYDGPAHLADHPTDLAVDHSGSIYVAGESDGLDSIQDFITIKYDSTGDTLWTRRHRMTDTLSCTVGDIEVDSFGNIYVAGYCYPGYSVIKYNGDGDILWTYAYQGDFGTGRLNAMKVDNAQNVYLTGIYDGKYTTVKLNANGLEQWVNIYNSPDANFNEPYDLGLDPDGNIYITGVSDGDPTGFVKRDIVTIKYDSNGNEQWVRRNDGINHGDDFGYALVVGSENIIYVTGKRDGENYTVAYDANGNILWERIYDAPSAAECEARDIEVDCKGNAYVAGTCYFQVNIERISTVKYTRNEQFNCFVSVEPLESEVLDIYPNPANDLLNISNVIQDDIFNIYNLLGELVFKIEINPGSNRIVMPVLPSGIYLYTLESGLKSGKLILQK